MISGQKVLAIISARGGSKGVPRKNIRDFAGKPLLVWTIEAAKKSKYIDRLILSSDNQEIIEVAEKNGCEVPYIRPAILALDQTSGVDPILHAVNKVLGYDLVILLQPTSPFRTVEDIDGCLENMVTFDFPACVSVTEVDQSPYWMYTIEKSGKMHSLIPQNSIVTRRQDLPPVYKLNGAVYVAEIKWLKVNKSFLTEQTGSYIMPKSRSHDIDTEEDFWLGERMFKR
ncbi:cytidylyltransferase domain-containing protein [Planomicrobium okeanokoites]|uniref:acylneuraminate cytidylyltransferase family protein n=1 Tax=Planomicrobium okeanokoites TaxID=244 RepID=UPI000A05F3A7|nr:acylneuraminate cytidylyltransferase family protein [Planomicrobium okeanokoites]